MTPFWIIFQSFTFVLILCQGKWWSYEKIQTLVAPEKEVVERVTSYLATRGITHIVNHQDSLTITTTVQKDEEFLQTTLFVFQHITGNNNIIRRDKMI